ncbi:MAG: hypothetical protein U0326_04425 [Polyangiales bacterium]
MSSYSCGLACFLSLALVTGSASAQQFPPLPPPYPPRTTQSAPTLPPPPPAPSAQTPQAPAQTAPQAPAQTALTLPPPPPVAELTNAAPQPATSARPRAFYRERRRLLDRALLTLPERSRDARITSGLINLAVGAGLMGLGFAPIWGEGSSPSVPQYLVWFQGGYNIAQGAVELIWTPSRERLGRQYMEMPVRTAQQRRARVRFGEESLDEIAADGRRRRILTAVTTVVYGLGTLGIFYRDQIFNGEPLPSPEALNYLVIGSIGIQSIISVIGAFSTSSDERMRDTYQRELQLMRESDDATD